MVNTFLSIQIHLTSGNVIELKDICKECGGYIPEISVHSYYIS